MEDYYTSKREMFMIINLDTEIITNDKVYEIISQIEENIEKKEIYQFVIKFINVKDYDPFLLGWLLLLKKKYATLSSGIEIKLDFTSNHHNPAKLAEVAAFYLNEYPNEIIIDSGISNERVFESKLQKGFISYSRQYFPVILITEKSYKKLFQDPFKELYNSGIYSS